jgi:hypothetical protein
MRVPDDPPEGGRILIVFRWICLSLRASRIPAVFLELVGASSGEDVFTRSLACIKENNLLRPSLSLSLSLSAERSLTAL